MLKTEEFCQAVSKKWTLNRFCLQNVMIQLIWPNYVCPPLPLSNVHFMSLRSSYIKRRIYMRKKNVWSFLHPKISISISLCFHALKILAYDKKSWRKVVNSTYLAIFNIPCTSALNLHALLKLKSYNQHCQW